MSGGTIRYPNALQQPPSGQDLPSNFEPLTHTTEEAHQRGSHNSSSNSTSPEAGQSFNHSTTAQDPTATQTSQSNHRAGAAATSTASVPPRSSPTQSPSPADSTTSTFPLTTSAASLIATPSATPDGQELPSEESGGLPTGTVAGISVGCIVFALLIIGILAAYFKSKKAQKLKQEDQTEQLEQQ